jgi:hypothetical protein
LRLIVPWQGFLCGLQTTAQANDPSAPNQQDLTPQTDRSSKNRDVAVEWFTQRRDADGRPHDPKVAKRLQEQAARTAAAAAGLAPEDGSDDDGGGFNADGGRGARKKRVARGPLPGEEDELMLLMRKAAADAVAAGWIPAPPAGLTAADRGGKAGAARRASGEQREGAEGGGDGGRFGAKKRVAVTARELAGMRSSLPSPNKLKGVKLAEQLEMKQSGELGALVSVGFLAAVGSGPTRRVIWSAA